jgi:peptidoglycan/LPS O-acetylase OafA/YrhL
MRSMKAFYRLAVVVTVGTTLVLIWLSLGVGIIGADGDPANAMYFSVPVIALIGGIIGRFKPRGMARTLLAMAGAQGVIALIALIAGLGLPWSGPAEIILLNGFFVVVFVGAAWLFKRSDHASNEAT